MRNLKKDTISFCLTAALLSSVSSLAVAKCASEYDREKPDHLYTYNLDGTVTDGETGLMWLKCPLGTTWNPGVDNASASDDSCDGTVTKNSWDQILLLADAPTVAGYSDWRLPNKKELASLMDIACSKPAINVTAFPLVDSLLGGKVWSSTAAAHSASKAWGANYNDGDDKSINKNSLAAGFLVRN